LGSLLRQNLTERNENRENNFLPNMHQFDRQTVRPHPNAHTVMTLKNDRPATIRRTVTFHPAVLQLANELCVLRAHTNVNDLLAELIRDRAEESGLKIPQPKGENHAAPRHKRAA
jgi:hypothetical protein